MPLFAHLVSNDDVLFDAPSNCEDCESSKSKTTDNDAASPYQGVEQERWGEVTRHLIEDHPLSSDFLLTQVQLAWNAIWQTRIGSESNGYLLREMNPSAQMIGFLLEKAVARNLAMLMPQAWRGGQGASEKDLHHITDPRYSLEMKTSGQLGFGIFGNRSYAQRGVDKESARKSKSGYYLTANFHGESLTLVRFGWIDAHDWRAQAASTGQMASLSEDAYRYKLVPLRGGYTLDAPIGVMSGVGSQMIDIASRLGLHTIRDILTSPYISHPKIRGLLARAMHFASLYGDGHPPAWQAAA